MSDATDASLVDLSLGVDISDIKLTKFASDTSDQSIPWVSFLTLDWCSLMF